MFPAHPFVSMKCPWNQCSIQHDN